MHPTYPEAGQWEAVRAAPSPISGGNDPAKGAGLGTHPEVLFWDWLQIISKKY